MSGMAKQVFDPALERGFALILLAGAIVIIVSIVGQAIRSTEHHDTNTYYEQQIIKTDAR